MIANEQNDFIRNIITNITKTEEIKGAIFNSTLCLISLNGIFYKIDLNGKIDPNVICGFTTEMLKMNEFYINHNDVIFNDVFSIYLNIYALKVNNLIFRNEDLRSDPNFEQIINSKSSDGAFKYFILGDNGINTFISLYRGIFNLNKPDKIGLSVYDIENSNCFLANFTVYKKKINMDYEISFMFMDLNKRRIL